MKEITLELNGMTCGSCERLIERVAQQNGATVREIDANSGRVTVECDEGILATLKQQLAERGFTEKTAAGSVRGDPQRVKKYISSVIAGEPRVHVESRLMNYAIGSAAGLILLGGAAYATLLQGMAAAAAYIPLIVLTIIGSIMSVFSYQHMMCYRKAISCTNGMMVGMTIGMITGFMAGALIGATNGMFIGSTAGLVIGIALGGNVGRCCGVMGAMEGIMAGLMAGIMGAMTSVMLINDNLIAFLYILFGVCVFVLAGLSYLMYRESGAAPKDELRVGFVDFFIASAAFSVALTAIMIYGPKGPITFP